MSDVTPMGREDVIELLTELGSRLHQRGERGDMFIVGGAAMAIAYNTRRTTRDVDGVFEPKTIIYEEAQHIARERGLPEDWLNDGVKGLLPGDDPQSLEVIDTPGIRVSAGSPRYMLALKVQSARVETDSEDLLHLAEIVGAKTSEDILNIAEEVIGVDRLTPKAQFFVQEAFPPSGPTSLRDRIAGWLQKLSLAVRDRGNRGR